MYVGIPFFTIPIKTTEYNETIVNGFCLAKFGGGKDSFC